MMVSTASVSSLSRWRRIRGQRAMVLMVGAILSCTITGAQVPQLPPDVARFQAEMRRQVQAQALAEAAANDKVGGKWRGVSRIKGSATISSRASINEGHLMPSDVWLQEDEVTVRFELRRDDSHGSDGLIWRAHDVHVSGVSRIRQSFNSGGEIMTLASDASYRGLPERLREMHLSLNTTDDGKWQISTPGHTKEKYTVTRLWNGQRFQSNEWVPVNETETELDNRVPNVNFTGVISEVPGPTTGTFEYTYLAAGKATRPGFTRGRIEFWPELDDYALEVTIADYAKWRPLGVVAAPDKPGNNLSVKATVITKGGGEPPQVKAIRFALIDGSREPGVCLNWPLGATDRNPDLKLAAVPECPGAVSQEDQRLEVTTPLVDAQRRPYALGQIDSYDFGGRATLRVTAELVDGRELVGELKGEGGEAAQDLIRLPQMSGPDWIAAVWKKENRATALPDADDSEKVVGQQYDGDGYTLYEEYRGWVVDGKRVEGDPQRKDFFVLNLIGADARKGIELFEKVSKLRVHSKLKRTEMSEKTRLMNGNHRDAPRRVKQHGVWVKTFDSVKKLGGTGAYTPFTKAGVSGRPGITVGIGLLSRNHADTTFNQPHNLPRSFSVLAFDRAIAHELLHSVGVEHHGESDSILSAQWTSPRNRRNKVGRPYFRELGSVNERALTILGENGHDLATLLMANYAREREIVKRFFWDEWIAVGRRLIDARQGEQLEFDTPEKYAENNLENMVGYVLSDTIVGEPHGQHSGVQECLMRYYFADLYPATSRANTYYLVTPGTELFGMELCRAKGGTGFNASSNKPQSRYGGAGPHGGNCFSQICPNDAIPPKKL